MNLGRLKQKFTQSSWLPIGLCLFALSMGRAAAAQTERLDGALSAAIFHADLTTMVSLVERGADANARDHDGDPVLFLAAERGDLEVVTFLLDRGAEADARDRSGGTGLMATVWWSQIDVSGPDEACAMTGERLLARGADINAQNNLGMTALMYAAGWEHQEALQMLLDHGANVHLRDRMGRTALTWATRNDIKSTYVQALLQHGATVQLLDAILLYDRATTQRLLAGKPDLSVRDGNGETALMAAAEGGDLPLVRVLLAKGATPKTRARGGLTALMLAFAGREEFSIPGGSSSMTGDPKDPDRLPIIRALLKAAAQVNARDSLGHTPLLWALKVSTPLMSVSGPDATDAEKTALAQRLLAHGADPFARDQFGATALTYATIGKDQALMALLREKGVRPRPIDVVSLRNATATRSLLTAGANARVYYETALMMAVKNADVETVHALLAKGADPNVRDQLGIPILIMVVRGEATDTLYETASTVSLQTEPHPEIIRALLAGRANVNIASRWEHVTPRMLASGLGQTDIVRLLLTHGANVNARNLGGSTALDYAQRYWHPAVTELLKQYAHTGN